MACFNVSIICSCGEVLRMEGTKEGSGRSRAVALEVSVLPCERCKLEAQAEGEAEGYRCGLAEPKSEKRKGAW